MKKHDAEELVRMAGRDGSFLVRQSSVPNTLTVSFLYGADQAAARGNDSSRFSLGILVINGC
jgi:hypothetical protein